MYGKTKDSEIWDFGKGEASTAMSWEKGEAAEA